MAEEMRESGGNAAFFAAAAELFGSMRESVNETIDIVAEPLMRDGTLAAAFRQGADELWQGLKAFPDTIEIHESGTILNPTQGEIAAARKAEPTLSLDEVLKIDKPSVPEPEHMQEKGMEL